MGTLFIIWMGLSSAPPVTAPTFAAEVAYEAFSNAPETALDWEIERIPPGERTCSEY